MTSYRDLIRTLTLERNAIEAAITALERLNHTGERGRPPGTHNGARRSTTVRVYKMSPATRRKMALARKQWWTAKKQSAS